MQDFATSLDPLTITVSQISTSPVIVFEMDNEEEMTFDANFPIKPFERSTSTALVSPEDVIVDSHTATTLTTLGPIAPPSPPVHDKELPWRRVCTPSFTEDPTPWRRPEKRNKKSFSKRPGEKSPKMELHNILNCFQVSDAVRHGIYIGESLRDPRYARLDSYYYDIQDSSIGVLELRKSLGPNNTPLSRESKKMFAKLQGLLGNLADRIGRVLDQQPDATAM
jgi:hypothetical protein